MADEKVQVGIEFKAGDRSGLDLIQNTAAGLDRTRKAIADAQKQGGLKAVVAAGELQAVKQLETDAALAATRLRDLMFELDNLSQSDPQWDVKAKEAADYAAQLNKITEAAAKIPDQINTGGSFRGGSIKGKESAGQTLGGIGGLAGIVSPEASQAAGAVNQLLQIGDGVKKLSADLIEAPGIIGKVASGAATLAAPLGATAAGLSAVLAILLPVALAIGGLALVVTRLNDKAKEGEESAKKYVEALDRQIKVDREIADFLESGDVEGAKRRYQELLKAQEDANAELTYLYQKKADIDKEYATAQRNVNLDQLSYLGSEGGKVQDRIKEIYNNSFVPATEAVADFAGSMDLIIQAAADKEAIQSQIDALNQRIEIETQLAGLIRDGNTGAFADRRQAIQDELTAIQNNLPGMKDLAVTSTDAADVVKELETRQRELNREMELYSPQAERAAQAQADLNKATADTLAAYVQQIQTAQQVASLLKSASSDQLNDRLESLQIERDAILSQLNNIKALGDTSDEAAAKAKEYENRLKAINDEFGALNDAAPDVRAAEVSKGLKEIEKAEVDTNRRIEDIRRGGLAKLVEIENRAREAQDDALDRRSDALAKATGDENAAISKVDSDYMAAEIKRWAKFRDDVARSEEKAKKDRLKIIDDTGDRLRAAEKANDVIAFIAAAEAGKKQLDQFDENAKAAADERKRAFDEEMAAALEEREARIADIRAQGQAARDEAENQYRADLAAAETARQEAIAQQQKAQSELIAAEEAGLLKRLAAIQDTYNLEDGLIQDIFNRRRENYAAEDKIINERLDLELQRHAADLKAKADSEQKENARAVKLKADTEMKAATDVANVISQNFIAAVTAIQGGLTGLINNIRSQLSTASVSGSGSVSGFGGSGAGSSSSKPGGGGLKDIILGKAFANQGVVDKPTVALIGENLKPGQREAVIKFNPSEGLPPDIMGARSPVQIGTLNLGSNISRVEIEQMIAELGGEIADGIYMARFGGNK